MAGVQFHEAGHGALMDAIYRRQKHIYDATRKFYLFGRDRLIAELACKPGMTVLDIGCGTGRNLSLIDQRWPGMRLYGIDISREMLDQARQKLGCRALLAQGDAGAFDAGGLLGVALFDRITISYALSMIPGWEQALAHAAKLLAPGGALYVVDFGDLAGMPGPLRSALRAWLRAFHVTPRGPLMALARSLAETRGLNLEHRRGPLGYYQMVILRRREASGHS